MKPDRDAMYPGPAGSHAGRAPCARICTRRLRLRSENGQAVTEFGMVLPLFAALVIVCVLFGKALYEYIQLTHAANEGARLAAVNQPAASSLSGFLTGEYALPGGTSLAICYPDQSVPADSRNAGKPVEVVAYSSASWVPILNIGQIKAKATMRLEQTTTANSNLNPLNTGEC